MSARDHSLEAAAEILGCKLRWLQDNVKRFEHQGYGKAAALTDAQLDAIRAACVVRPVAEQPEAGTAPVTRIPITQLKPRQRSRNAG